jgi:GNAT superfamily N-acetyltransferase
VTIEVRPARASDVVQLLDLVQRHAAFERLLAPISRAELAAILEAQTPPTTLVVADEDGDLLGYAALTFDYALFSATRFGHLDCLFVREDARGHGIGKRLLDHVGRLAAAAGAPRLEWQTPVWNADGIRFYERERAVGLEKMRFSQVLARRGAARGEAGS